MEEWRDIPGYEGAYMVSSYGRIKALARFDGRGHKKKEHILKCDYVGTHGYHIVNLRHCGNERLAVPIHRIVAEVFISNPDNLPVVNHKDGNKLNNTVDNLEWVTQSENVRHAVKNKLMKNHYYARTGEKCPYHKFSDKEVESIREMRRNGAKMTDIMKKFNISKSHAYKIVNNRERVQGSGVRLCRCI